MRPGKMTHYLISIFAGIIGFFLGYELLQEFVTRDLPDDPALQLATRFILNLYFAGFLSGAVYAATFKRGYLPIADHSRDSVRWPFSGSRYNPRRDWHGTRVHNKFECMAVCDPSCYWSCLQLHQCKDHAPVF